MDEEITSAETQTTVSNEGEKSIGDIRALMLKEIDEDSSNKNQDDSDSKVTGKEEEPSDESKEEEGDKDPEDSDDKEDEDKEDDKKDDEAKKPNRYQRLKAQRDLYKKQVEEATSERDEAVKYANIYRNRFIAIQQRMAALQKAATENGLQVNPLDEENFALKLSQKEQELTQEYEKTIKQERIKQQLLQEKQEQTQMFINEALTISSKFVKDQAQVKVFARDVLKAHAIALRTDPDAKLSDTAKLVASMKGLASSEKIQHEVNSGVKRPIKPATSGGKPTFKNLREEMMASLDAELKGE